MAILLNIETATKNCSVSLCENEQILALSELNEGQFSHAEKLHTFILDVLNTAQKKMKDIDAIAISKGPGSYTGLRIGVSAAKGLCFALDKPLIAVPTLDSLANTIEVAAPNQFIIPLLDARRMEVYCTVFDAQKKQIQNTEAKIIDKDSFSAYLEKGEVYLLGDGAEKCKEIIKHKNAIFIDHKFPSAEAMCTLSLKKYHENDFEDLAYFEPFYLKDFVAGKPKKLF